MVSSPERAGVEAKVTVPRRAASGTPLAGGSCYWVRCSTPRYFEMFFAYSMSRADHSRTRLRLATSSVAAQDRSPRQRRQGLTVRGAGRSSLPTQHGTSTTTTAIAVDTAGRAIESATSGVRARAGKPALEPQRSANALDGFDAYSVCCTAKTPCSFYGGLCPDLRSGLICPLARCYLDQLVKG